MTVPFYPPGFGRPAGELSIEARMGSLEPTV
jgi:hypothetical protein